MRIRIIRRPAETCIDGIQLDRFEPGYEYEVSTALGCLFLAEQWADPVVAPGPALAVPLTETADDLEIPANLIREDAPPYFDPALASLFRRHRAKHRR